MKKPFIPQIIGNTDKIGVMMAYKQKFAATGGHNLSKGA